MKKSPCDKCDARCCKYNHILLEEYERFKYISADIKGYLVIPMIHGKCPYLEGNRCSIYEIRPKSCRTFECIYGYKKRKGKMTLSEFLKDNPDVVKLIEDDKK